MERLESTDSSVNSKKSDLDTNPFIKKHSPTKRINKQKFDRDAIVHNDIELGVTTTISPTSDAQVNNNWSETNMNTLRNWKISLIKASFIYQLVSENSKSKLNTILVLSLILSTISTIISGLSTMALTVDNPTYKLVALIINGILFVISAIITFLHGAVKIYKWDEIVATFTAYIEKIDQLYSIVANQLVLPDSLRIDAIVFIKNQSEHYLNLIKQSPDIDTSDYQNANIEYMKYLKDESVNFKYSQKYSIEDSIIEVV